ncbi:hypothetical protein [Neogemmobacter tilapiae]|uniref:Uncharacterized protein n=1 Tax=Neogemmobacter tilapiae TaxID=875041 RepID=A0A918WP80_9RHOB|nr:hypothetical protein [Gemmobacter tilapiae]GHC67525.1 hypothetical protein GCM10007315_35710 [Gemmobacter tilapiae]
MTRPANVVLATVLLDQTIIRSAVSDKSYVWKGGNEVGYEKAEGAEAVTGERRQ